MEKQENIFSNSILKIALIILLGIFLGFLIVKGQMVAIGALIAAVLGIFYIIYSFRYPTIPLKTVLIFSFFVIGITRYVDGPFGLAIDFLLVFCWIVSILTGWRTLQWENTHSFFIYFSVIWFVYICIELLNPLSIGAEPWFYAMRGISL